MLEYQQVNNNQETLFVTPIIKNHLLETVKWSKFLAIVGFVMVGILILIGLFYGTILSYFGATTALSANSGIGMAAFGGFFAIIYILIAVLYFLPAKYLYDFSVKTKKALTITDQNLLDEAFLKLKSHYKYIGILTLIGVILYALMFVFIIIAGIASLAL